MAFLKLLLNAVIIFTGATASYMWEPSPNILQDDVKPIHYDIHIEIGMETKSNIIFFGQCEIVINFDYLKQRINLHAQKPQIEVSKATLTRSDKSNYKFSAKKFIYTNNNVLSLDFGHIIAPGRYALNMIFNGSIHNDEENFFKSSYINRLGHKTLLVATHFWPIGARHVFPCWDVPESKATFNISIKHNYKYTALSNMPRKYRQSVKDKMIWTQFHKSSLMPINHVTFVVSNLNWYPYFNGNVRLILWCRQYTYHVITSAKSFAIDVTQYLQKNWPDSNRNSTANHIVIPNTRHDNIRSWRFVFYREADIIYDKRKDPIACKIEMIRLIGYKVVHEWYDSLFNSWPDSSLNEAFVRWLGTYFINKMVPHLRMMDLFVVQTQHESFRLESIMKSLVSEISNNEIISLSFFSRYIKGPVIFRMLYHVITDNTFWNSLREYINQHISVLDIEAQISDNLDHFLTVLQFVYIETFGSAVIDIKDMLEFWTKQKHYPILKVTRFHGSLIGYMKIWLENYNILGAVRFKPMQIPLTFATQRFDNFDFILPKFWLIPVYPKNNSIAIPSHMINTHSGDNDWVIFNLQQIGYYRVNYDNENWLNIANYLNSEQYTKIHVLNRAQIIDDAFFFLIENELSYSTFLYITSYLEREIDYVAWYPMIKIFEYMSCVFPFQQSANIKAHMRDIVSKLLRKIGYEEQLNEDHLKKCLRQEATKWACVLNDPKCKSNATYIFENYIKNPRKNNLLPWWRQWTFCNSLMAASKSTITLWMLSDNWLNIFNDKSVKFLACSEHISIARNYFMTTNNRVNTFLLIIAKHAKNNITLEYILTYFDEILPWEVSTMAALIVIINHLYSEEQLHEIIEFAQRKLKEQSVAVTYFFEYFKYFKYPETTDLDNKALVNAIMKKKATKLLLDYIHYKINRRLSEITKQKECFWGIKLL